MAIDLSQTRRKIKAEVSSEEEQPFSQLGRGCLTLRSNIHWWALNRWSILLPTLKLQARTGAAAGRGAVSVYKRISLIYREDWLLFSATGRWSPSSHWECPGHFVYLSVLATEYIAKWVVTGTCMKHDYRWGHGISTNFQRKLRLKISWPSGDVASLVLRLYRTNWWGSKNSIGKLVESF